MPLQGKRWLPKAQVTVADLHVGFGLCEQPGYAKTDKVADLGLMNVYESEAMSYNNVLDCIHANPAFPILPHHNLIDCDTLEQRWPSVAVPSLEAPAYPCVPLHVILRSETTEVTNPQFDRFEYHGVHAMLAHGARNDPKGLNLVVGSKYKLDTQGFTVLKRHVIGDSKNIGPRFIVQLDCNDGGEQQIEVRFTMQKGIEVYRLDVAASKAYLVGRLRSSDSQERTVAFEAQRDEDRGWEWQHLKSVDQTGLSLMLLNGVLLIWMHGDLTPLAVSLVDRATGLTTVTKFSAIRLYVHGGRYLYTSIHPVKFATTAYMIGPEHNTGFMRSAATPIRYIYSRHLNGGEVTIEDALEIRTTFRYKLTIANPEEGRITLKDENGNDVVTPYASKTATVESVTPVISPLFLHPGGSGVVYDGPYSPRAIRLGMQFDWNNLTIYTQGNLTFPNRHGEWQAGWPSDHGYGHRAMAIDLGWLETTTRQWGLQRQLTGIAGGEIAWDRKEAPESVVSVSVEDLSKIPREYLLMNVPWMDGWCHYYAIRFLARLAGLTDEAMDFPYCDSPDCSNADHYHLPMGEGGKPLMYFPPGTPAWAAMLEIRKLVGYVMYFDAMGKLRYYPWVRTSPGPFKRIYREVYTPAEGNTGEIRHFAYRRSTATIRNTFTILGVDAYAPLWRPVIAHRGDWDSIYNPSAPNYVGFRKPFAWSDSRFTNLDYASEAADRMFALLRLPSEEVSFELALGDPEIFPLDVIGIDERKTPAGVGHPARAFFVTAVQHDMEMGMQQSRYTSVVNGRWIV